MAEAQSHVAQDDLRVRARTKFYVTPCPRSRIGSFIFRPKAARNVWFKRIIGLGFVRLGQYFSLALWVSDWWPLDSCWCGDLHGSLARPLMTNVLQSLVIGKLLGPDFSV